MILGFGNNVVSALAGDITTIQTDIPVMPGTGAKFAKLLSADFENKSNGQRVYAKITLTDNKESAFEICHLVSVRGDVLKVIRGQEGTTAKGWSLNDVVANFATRGSENYFVQIAQLQSGHYIAGVAGGTANTLTLELPSTFFVNEGTDWTLRTPIIVFPVQNNTNAATLQLTLGGKVLGTFPLYKGNKSELVANDIIKGIPLICLLDSEKGYFSVINPGNIYSDFDLRYVKKSGDLMTGKLTLPQTSAFGVNTENKLGGNSLTIGEGGTGVKQESGALSILVQGNEVFYLEEDTITAMVDILLNGYLSADKVMVASSSGSWISMRNQSVFLGRNPVSTNSAQALLRQDHASRKFFVAGLGDNQFGIYMINNGRSDNGTDGQAYMDNAGNWRCGRQMIPSDYGNFDARYQTKTGGVQDVRLGGAIGIGRGGNAPSGHLLSGVDGGESVDWANARPVQVLINGVWRNVASL
ncbi:phage tail protein [Escherichia coli]|uniref:phage tail protein n=1 Tax=Escherichia coli TaxID=562 RepID=UPI000CFAC96E|nr:phage tail protein [Escherichia coli]